MNTFLTLLLIFLFSSCSTLFTKNEDIYIVHYNIKELDSTKIKNNSNQITHVKKVLENLNLEKANIISINEIQFDLPNVPNSTFKTQGQNMASLLALLGEKPKFWNYSFFPANTGMRAKTKPGGEYYSDFSDSKVFSLADQTNFGIFPAQYSTGAAYKFKKISEVEISSLKWKSFNQKININSYTQGDGKKLNSKMELFDKNFTDVLLDIKGHPVHLILLHTVPAYHFGNKKSPNYDRNADQLRFLEWYLTGSTDISVNLKNIKPLGSKDSFIAVGDWNTDINNKLNPGSKVLKRLFEKTKLWTSSLKPTHESDGYKPDRLKMVLDYIITSKDLTVVQGGIYTPEENRLILGCDQSKALKEPISDGRVRVSYFDKSKNKTCYIVIDQAFYNLKMASDHMPIWAKIRLNK